MSTYAYYDIKEILLEYKVILELCNGLHIQYVCMSVCVCMCMYVLYLCECVCTLQWCT